MAANGQNRLRTRPVSRDDLDRRTARIVGLAGFLCAAALPVVLWHRAIEIIATDFRLELEYLVTGWTAYALIAAGLLFSVPVVLSIGRRPESRLYPRSRQAYAAWGVVLYLLGMVLASQVGQIAATPST
ncbi:MAG: hypothetical protein H0W05_02595 [Thermoleophilaceae bacterium]|nr:hypothetical protein [Thermoleophilaceae bacterium]